MTSTVVVITAVLPYRLFTLPPTTPDYLWPMLYGLHSSLPDVQFSHSVMSDSLRPHWLRHARLPCPSPAPGACSNSCPWSQWCWLPSPPRSSPYPAFNLSQHQDLFRWVSLHIRWPKNWSFSFSIRPSNEYSELILFRMDWLDLLAVQGTLKSLLQHYSSKTSILWCSAFFIVQQLSHPYMTTRKTIALTRRTFVGKVNFAF